MSKDEETILKVLLVKHISDSNLWRQESDKKIKNALTAVEKSNDLTTTSHDLIVSELKELMVSVKSLESKVSDNTIDINRYNKIEAFIENISTFGLWILKFTLGFITIGGAIWGAGVFIYRHFKG